MNDNGEFFNYEEFSEIFGIQTNYLQYCGTIKAIKTYLKKQNNYSNPQKPESFITMPFFSYNKKQAGSKGYVYFKP